MRRLVLLAALILPPLLAGCEMLGIESPERIAAAREADGKAVGGACRHAGRAIEDCYALNRKAERAAVFAGWRDMNDYMRENKIEVVPPQGIATAQARVTEPPAEPAAAIEKQRPAKPGIDGIKPRPRSS
jgi:hypothetical protein